jgi:hypothetical protein
MLRENSPMYSQEAEGQGRKGRLDGLAMKEPGFTIGKPRLAKEDRTMLNLIVVLI